MENSRHTLINLCIFPPYPFQPHVYSLPDPISYAGMCSNQPNPNFRTTPMVDYYFERRTQILVELFDVDDARSLDNFQRHNYIGHVEFSLSQLMGARKNTIEIPLDRAAPPRVPRNERANQPLRPNQQRGRDQSTIIIRGEELKKNTDFVMCQVRCLKLSTPGWFSSTNAAVQVGFKADDGTFIPLAETVTVLSNSDPTFPPIRVPITRLLAIPPKPGDFVVPPNVYEPLPPEYVARLPPQTAQLYPNTRGRPVSAGNYSAPITFRVINYKTPIPDRSYTQAQIHQQLRTIRQQRASGAAEAKSNWKNEEDTSILSAVAVQADASGNPPELIGETTVPLYTVLTTQLSQIVLNYAPPQVRSVLEQNSTQRRTRTLHRPGKKANSLEKVRGTILIEECNIWCQPTFIDYVRNGLDFRLVLAIDFTGSNGHYLDRGSLHELKDGQFNQYQRAIQQIGSIVADYTKSSQIPVYGFGAVVSVDDAPKAVSHCFPLTRKSYEPMVDGIEGVLRVYRETMPHLSFSGPTNFAQIIRTATSFTMQPYTPSYQHFTILMILTDGLITDMEQTIAAIVDASHYPIAIIIVGVGNENFSSMVVLDSDDAPLTDSHGRVAQADIVQFVPFLQAVREGTERLAEMTLQEIPNQVLKFMRMHGIYPIHPDDLMARRASTLTPNFDRGASMVPGVVQAADRTAAASPAEAGAASANPLAPPVAPQQQLVGDLALQGIDIFATPPPAYTPQSPVPAVPHQ